MESLLRKWRAEASLALRGKLRAEDEPLGIFYGVEKWDKDSVSS
jgi:hypothetical protein